MQGNCMYFWDQAGVRNVSSPPAAALDEDQLDPCIALV